MLRSRAIARRVYFFFTTTHAAGIVSQNKAGNGTMFLQCFAADRVEMRRPFFFRNGLNSDDYIETNLAWPLAVAERPHLVFLYLAKRTLLRLLFSDRLFSSLPSVAKNLRDFH